MKITTIASFLAIALLAGCGGAGFGPPGFGTAAEPAGSSAWLAPKAHQDVYWTLFAGSAYPQVQIAKVPLTTNSKVASIVNSTKNDLLYSSAMATDSTGRLWVLSFGRYNGSPTSALVFKLPLTAKSAPSHTYVLLGTNGSDAIAFDPSGNLWVTSPGNHSFMEYKPSPKKNAKLKPLRTFPSSNFNAYGIAVDKNANVYISINNSTGTNSIAVLKPPYKKKDTYFLNGLTYPGGLLFDAKGNLYASTNPSSGAALVRYGSNDLKKGDTPSIVDSTGLPSGSYLAAFAFTAKGDLYAANCGNTTSAGIDVYPTGTHKFSSNLAPSVIYTNSDIGQVGCAWGIAIK
ncbi:MAG: hypothetical protein JO263_01165 [Candidatus Eremiobacteraeota bacterium]|nr:hypothetical protein [Candidatus Eremiobacteraeota bacterium]